MSLLKNNCEGFDGKELGDLHVFDLEKGQWNQPAVSGDAPSNRSVSFMCSLGGEKLFTFGGEADPSQKGHEGESSKCN